MTLTTKLLTCLLRLPITNFPLACGRKSERLQSLRFLRSFLSAGAPLSPIYLLSLPTCRPRVLPTALKIPNEMDVSRFLADEIDEIMYSLHGRPISLVCRLRKVLDEVVGFPLSPMPRPSNALEREFFFTMIESKAPGKVYYCPGCMVVHSFQQDYESLTSVGRRSPEALCPSLKFMPSFSLAGGGFRLEYPQLRLLMNNHTFGPSAGLPVNSLFGDGLGVKVPLTHSVLDSARVMVRFPSLQNMVLSVVYSGSFSLRLGRAPSQCGYLTRDIPRAIICPRICPHIKTGVISGLPKFWDGTYVKWETKCQVCMTRFTGLVFRQWNEHNGGRKKRKTEYALRIMAAYTLRDPRYMSRGDMDRANPFVKELLEESETNEWLKDSLASIIREGHAGVVKNTSLSS